MSTKFTELRSQATQIDVLESAPTGDELYEGRVYFDPTLGRTYVYINSAWKYAQLTTTSTSTTSSSTTSTSTSTTSSSTTSTSTTSTSTSTSSTSTSTTLW